MHWRRKWQPTPVFLPGESHGRRSPVGCSPWGRTESDTTEATWQAATSQALQMAETRSERQRERYTQLNVEFQRIARGYKKAFLSEQ